MVLCGVDYGHFLTKAKKSTLSPKRVQNQRESAYKLGMIDFLGKSLN